MNDVYQLPSQYIWELSSSMSNQSFYYVE